MHTQQLINEIVVDESDPAAANALQEGFGALLQGIGTEEISHVELIGTTIACPLTVRPSRS